MSRRETQQSLDLRGAASSPLLRTTVAIAAVALGIASVVAHASEYGRVERFSKDFALDYSSAKAFLHGDDPYAPIQVLVGRYLHPPAAVVRSNVLPGANWHTPFKLLVTLPFTALPYQAAGVLWLLVSAASFVVAGTVLGAELGWSRRASLVLGAGFLAVPVVQIDLSAGQLNGPMLLLLVLAWRWARRGDDTVGGIALGLLVAIKFFPAFLALPLIGARRWKPAFIAAACAVVLSGVGMALLGAEHTRSFLSAGRGSEGFDYWDASPANIAWWGIATRWLVPNGWVDTGVDARAVGLTIASAGIVVLCVAAAFPKARLTREPMISAIPLMLLAWPIVWEHYLALALPFVVLSVRTAMQRERAGLMLPLVVVVGFLLLLGFPPGGGPLERASTLDVVLRYQLPTVALLAGAVLDRAAFGSEKASLDARATD